MTDRITFAAKVTSDGRRLKGSVILAGSRTFRDGEYVEVDPAALVKADATDVVATIDHDRTKVMGRTRNGTLMLNRTDQGISFETADLPNTTAANDALELARGDYFAGSSFAIEGLRSKFDHAEDGTRIRRITSIKRLVDVSLVMDPAFSNSTAAAFSKESSVPDIDDEKAPEPKVEPAKADPKPDTAKFTQTTDDAYETAVKFAKRQDIEQIENVLDSIMASPTRTPAQEVQYRAFATVYDQRKAESAETKARVDQLKFEHDLRRGNLKKAGPDFEVFGSSDYKAAFGRYLRTGDRNIMEQFAGQSIAGSGAEGGYTVPTDFRNVITETKKAYGGIQKVADTIETGDGRDLPWPTNDDTANSAAIATEGSAVGSGGADLVFGQVSLGAYTYDATGASNLPLLVSKELLQDSAFDVEAFVGRKLGQRLGRKMAADYGNGTGSSQPFGLFAKTPDAMTATAMYAALVEHHFQVDQAYRDSGNCRWVLGDTILTKIWASVDGNKRPLYTALDASGGQAGPAGMLLGYPVTLDQSSAANVAFGDIQQGFIIRNVRGITVDVDPYSNIKSRQIAFHAWARTDSAVQDSAAYSVSDYTSVNADS